MRAVLFLACLTSLPLFSSEWIPPDASLQKLEEGNRRFVKNQAVCQGQDSREREANIEGQSPFAVILSCADSRVAPEIIFDQGIGDLFIVRNAGNVASPIAIESINYAVDVLGASLLVVMGHESCGAVNAVLKGITRDIPAIARMIDPAIERSGKQKGDRLHNAVIDNVEHMVEKLSRDPTIASYLSSKKLKLTGAYYSFKTGRVEFLR